MKNIKIAFLYFLVMSVLTGIIYTSIIAGVSQLLFEKKANGSLIIKSGKTIGSELIGQNFKDPKYFWPRPSASNYNPIPSGGTNLGATSKELKSDYEARKQKLGNAPNDMLFSSASGLDPHITLESARYQINRVSLARGLTKKQIGMLDSAIDDMVEGRTFGILGEKRINVLKLNLEIDKIAFQNK